MIRVLLFLSLFFMMLHARENPFFPVQSGQDIPLTSNQTTKLPMLKRATVTLPSTARTIESVTVTYKNLDGSIAHKKVTIQNAIDWHLPVFISQNYNESDSTQSIEKQIKKSSVKIKYKKVASLKFIAFYVKKNKLKIVTKDKMLRNFLLVKPHRIVCDFKRDTDIGSLIKSLKEGSLFTKIRLGTHKGYYRVVIELDGYYSYKLDYIRGGYIITLL
ncbi:AMIN domain-containing protein [Sulfurimonas sp. NW7]|uniref:AMIN domain-containing protein n=1 Tax=Sulfurimonas sp. NW7 TaxID=2922727 RepID=UPI003DA803CE